MEDRAKREFLDWLKLHVHSSKLLYNVAKKMPLERLEAGEYHNRLEKSVITYYGKFKGKEIKHKPNTKVKKMKTTDKIISALMEEAALTVSELCKKTNLEQEMLNSVLKELENDNIVKKRIREGETYEYYLPKKNGKIVLTIKLKDVVKIMGKSEIIEKAIEEGNYN